MNKLYVLAERNILDYLHSIGVYPYQFFTDAHEFKVQSPYFEDAIVVVIFSGACNFVNKFVCTQVINLRQRVLDSKDNGILSVDVLSDSCLVGLDKYYKYEDYPKEGVLHSRKKKLGKDFVDVWGMLDYEKYDEPVKTYLVNTDLSAIIERLQDKRVGTDSALQGIKIPTYIQMN